MINTSLMDQPQREAIFDFLVLAMFADSNLKLKEDEQLYQLAHALGWESPRDPEEYAKLATARVRAAVETDGGVEPFLAKLSVRLRNEEARRKALELFSQLAAGDGAVDSEEHEISVKAKTIFGV
jgi:hypothetical protein